MKLFKRIAKYLLCIVLAAITLATPILSTLATEGDQTLYVKDVKFLYGKNLEEAKKHLPEGYIMLDTDLNQGAAYISAVDDVYLAYSTTTNPNEAITDMRMMNMKGGFVMSDYEEQMKNISGKVAHLASQLKCACDEFVKNYNANTYGGKSAYTALNFFKVDEADGVGLGDYLVYKTVPEDFYIKLMLNAHTDILSSILSVLAIAVQGKEGDTWLDRLSDISDPEKITNSSYWDKADGLWPVFDNFFNIYDSIDHDIYRGADNIAPSDEEDGEDGEIDENEEEITADVDNTGNEILYEMAYETLDRYSFGDGTSVAEWFVNDSVEVETLYPLIEVLTPAEYAMMTLCGPLFMTLATGMSEKVYENYKKEIDALVDETGGCSIWYGVNSDLFRSSIGITDEANRAIAETQAEQELANDSDSSNDSLLRSAGMVASIGAIALGSGLILSKTIGAIFALCKLAKIAAGFTITGNVTMVIGAVIICVALVMAIVHVALWLKDWYDEYHPEYSDIPEYMYDMVLDDEDNSKFVLYEVAKFHDGKFVDVNAKEGREWHAVYISRDPAAGKPIEADFKIKLGDGRVDDGYVGLRAFGGVVAENLNSYAFSDDVDGIFVSYRQQPQEGDYAKGKYLSDVKLFSDKNEILAKSKLTAEGYTLYNLNLTPDSNKHTYLGYKTSNNSRRALTDIRVCYGYSSTQYSTGGANGTYAASGSAGNLTLYSTRVSLFGTPILSDFIIQTERDDVPAGYEPVNMFTGGPAVNLNMGSEDTPRKDIRLFYFLPSETYTSGTKYISGIAAIYDRPADGYVNDVHSVRNMISHLGYDTLSFVYGTVNAEGAIIYTTTYNPYRAIYDVMVMSNGGSFGKYFSQCIRYDDVSYSLATRYCVGVSVNASIDLKSRSNDSRIYCAGIYNGGEPMTLDDIIATKDENYSNNEYYPLTPQLINSNKPANLSAAFNYSYETTIQDDVKVKITVTVPPMYLYTKKAPEAQNKYITDIFISSKEDLIYGLDIDCEDLDNSYLTANLASMGATHIIRKNINLKESDNSTYLGYSRNTDKAAPITDIILYLMKDTKDKPKYEITKNKITYKLASDINLFCDENGTNKKCDRVYVYYTTNPAAGSPIIDITIDNTHIKNGWSTVLTQNDKALHNDMDDYRGDMWFLHVKRTDKVPQYVSDVYIGWGGSEDDAKTMLIEAGCDYIIEKDLNDNCSIITDYVFLGYKRTDDINKAIRDLRTTHDNEVDSFKKNGATYTKIKGNLNVFTNIFADDIFLYYTKDPVAGDPIVELAAVEEPRNYILGNSYILKTVVNQHDKYSDLNEGAAGDYIYLVMYRNYNIDPSNWLGNVLGTSPLSYGSMIGEGSIIALSAFAVIAILCIAAAIVYRNKKQTKICNEAKAIATGDENDA